MPDAGVAASVSERAQLDEDARVASGVSVSDVQHIEQMLAAVMARRAIASITGSTVPLPDLERLSAGLSAEQRAQAQRALAGLKESNEHMNSLVLERQQFGDENIRTLLERETELTQNFERLSGLSFSLKAPSKVPKR